MSLNPSFTLVIVSQCSRQSVFYFAFEFTFYLFVIHGAGYLFVLRRLSVFLFSS